MKRLTKKRVRLLLSFFTGLLFIFLGGYYEANNAPLQNLAQTPPGTYRVIRVEDGDTITVDMNGSEERVRYIGIDTPETKDPRKPVQCFGRAASEFNKQFIGSNPVRLEADPLSGNRDRYNRLLRYVYLPDGRLAQAEILKQGYGFAYVSFPFTKSEEFLNYQREAREQNRGLWNSCQPETNKYGGYTSNPE
jgi:micrococcal nuclease